MTDLERFDCQHGTSSIWSLTLHSRRNQRGSLARNFQSIDYWNHKSRAVQGPRSSCCIFHHTVCCFNVCVFVKWTTAHTRERFCCFPYQLSAPASEYCFTGHSTQAVEPFLFAKVPVGLEIWGRELRLKNEDVQNSIESSGFHHHASPGHVKPVLGDS